MKEFVRQCLESELNTARHALHKGDKGDEQVDASLTSMRHFFRDLPAVQPPAQSAEEQLVAVVYLVARTIHQMQNPATHGSAERLLAAIDYYIAMRGLFR